jgi:hypothetical protein
MTVTIAGIFEISAWTSICRQEAASATMAARVVARCPAFYVLPFMPLRVLPFADPGPIWWRHHAEAINLPGATALFEEPFVPGAPSGA